MDLKKRSLERRLLRGSLPFKKRCFSSFETQLSAGTPQPLFSSETVVQPLSSLKFPCFSNSAVADVTRAFQKGPTNGSAFTAHLQLGCSPSSEEKSPASRSNPPSLQDKRFSGLQGEVRCLATTTRGRECAYVAVDGTKYCYMHAEYDTNPPPRRGGCTSKETKMKSTQRSSSMSSDSSGKSVDRKRRSTAEKLAQKHADSPFPLLSMISSDQWASKLVRISTGPFQGYVGKVEKWSNGWVGVRIPEIGLHNRRSFELYLETEEPDDYAQTQNRNTVPNGVSRDAVTPSPHPPGKRTPSPKDNPVTPNPSMEEGDVYFPGKATNTPSPADGVALPQVTPTESRSTITDRGSPEIKSFLETQERNPKLDLLFGTAALDRSRRRIRRPKIYQDTEMLDKKRSRKVSLGLD